MTNTNQTLAGRTILISAGAESEIATELARCGARLIVWPAIELSEPESLTALDEAIDNLFGYHWIIFSNFNSAEYFLRRFQQLDHEISELDALRICAFGEATARRLEESQVHVDLIPERFASAATLSAIENFVGGHDALRGLNFLIPHAAISHDRLPQLLEDAGARADVVNAYRTVSRASELTQISALLAGGAIDCVFFDSAASVQSFARLFDTNDLPHLLKEVAVACIDGSTLNAAIEFGLRADISPLETVNTSLASLIRSHLSR